MHEMELESSKTNQTYIQLLIDSSKMKMNVLKELTLITEQQEELLKKETFEEDLFSQTISQKDKLLNQLIDLDQGFERIYSSVKDELTNNKHRYEVEIRTLQEYIASITDLSVKLQALELRNKTKLEAVLAIKRRDIRKSKVSSQTATNYYKTMTNQHEVQSFFYDKKK
jgi:flagellar biosynthesis/type III secretory pathway chaperone